MRFVSLQTPTDVVSFEDALTHGVPADGGLYTPESVPPLGKKLLAALPSMSPAEQDRTLLGLWLSDEIPAGDLDAIVASAATFETPVVQVADKYVLELFHGPSLSFTDFAASYLAAFIAYFNKKRGKTSTILLASSGDTGGAIAQSFGGIPDVRVVLLYPKDRVSELQREQMRRVDENIHSIEIDGDFDDCQSLVKQAFDNRALALEANLTTANSANVGRLLAQTLYFARAWAQIHREDLRFAVPSGSLGNLTAGVLAQRMGIPISSFIGVNNQNDALYRYSHLGRYEPHRSTHTLSNALDVSEPRDMPRLRHLFEDSVRKLRSDIQVSHISDEQTVDTIVSIFEETGYMLGPHAAVAWSGCEEFPALHERDVVVATDSPLKYSIELERLTGIKSENATELTRLREKPERYQQLPNSIDELQKLIRQL